MMKRLFTLSLFLLSLGACSCAPRPPLDAADNQTNPEAVPSDAKPTVVPASPTPATAKLASDHAFAHAQAASTLHTYLRLLAAGDQSQADTFWVGGRPPANPGDFAVRALTDMHSLRIRNDPPRSLGDESRSEAIEIPVRLQARLDTGDAHTIAGYYRMQRKPDGNGWKITSASLQPILD